MGDRLSPPAIGVATEQGPNRALNADTSDTDRWHSRIAVAVVDGTGDAADVARFADLAAGVAVRVGVRRSPMLGILAAAELTADPTVDFPWPDGAIVVAAAAPGEPWLVAWAGDCDAYAWDGTTCTRLTTPHTNGQVARDRGDDETTARRKDRELRHSIGRATVNSVPTVASHHPTLVLASDGLRLPADHIASILTDHPDPGSASEALVKAGRAAGSTDDITVLVAPHPQPPAPQLNPERR